MRTALALLGASLFLAAGPALARPVTAPPTMGEAVTQPLRDLSIVRRQIPPVLQRAMSGPYDAPAPTTCAQIAAEIGGLDEALGPDYDDEGGVQRTSMVRSLAVEGVRSVINLPYRGLVRTITGARRRDERLQSAIMAGVSRRAFLKGLQRAMVCDAPEVMIAAAPPELVLIPPPAGAQTGAAIEAVAVVEDR